MFYEEVAKEPPFFLRRFLPTPIGTEGCKSEVGSEVKCRYVDGHLLKRVTHIVRGHNYAFEIIEQNLALRGIRVLGGDYTLRRGFGDPHSSRAGNSLCKSELSSLAIWAA